MPDAKDKRQFSNLMREANSAFLPSENFSGELCRVGFVLQEHFSMMAFTAAVDALVTANLVRTNPLFSYQTYGLDSAPVTSDLGIEIATHSTLTTLAQEITKTPDILIICGGFRCNTSENTLLSQTLRQAAKQGLTLGGLWNGAIALAHSGLLDNMSCALHPDNHAFMREKFPKTQVADQVFISDNKRLTCAGPVSALEMMLNMIEHTHGKQVVRAIREILSCDQLSESSNQKLTPIGDDPCLPKTLRDLIELMAANIEEPMSVDDLTDYVDISRRQAERLFQTHLDTSPGRYYLELRITHARRLLLQSNASVTNIALASGFVSTSHFSNCYKDYFGISPSHAREKAKATA